MMTPNRRRLLVGVAMALGLVALGAAAADAQVPADLQQAMRARDQAIAKADATTWDRMTTEDFTVVLEDGRLLTKKQRLEELKKQKPESPTPNQQEQVKRYGDAYIRRFKNGNLWVLDVWVRGATGWQVAAVQVTTVGKSAQRSGRQ